MKCLLDTNICIYIIKKKPKSAIKKITSYSIGDIGISSITLAELAYGVSKSQQKQQNQEALENFLISIEIYPFDDLAAIEYGSIRAELESQGTPIGPMDLLIAAHARSLGLPVITNNTKEFMRVNRLQVENWV